MKKILLLSFTVLFAFACSNNASDSSKSEASEQEDILTTAETIEKYDPNRGHGKFDEEDVEISDNLNTELAKKGESIFSVKCGSCHKLSDEMLVGPGLKGISERRTGVWVMNFLTNTDEMIDLDDELQAQLELCMVRMPNQNLSDDDARAIYEFMRQNDGVK